MWHGIMSFYGPMWFGDGIKGTDGKTQSHWFNSSSSFTIIIHFVTAKLFIESVYWTWTSLLAAGISLLLYYITVLLGSLPYLSYFFQMQATGLLFNVFTSPKFWIV